METSEIIFYYSLNPNQEIYILGVDLVSHMHPASAHLPWNIEGKRSYVGKRVQYYSRYIYISSIIVSTHSIGCVYVPKLPFLNFGRSNSCLHFQVETIFTVAFHDIT